MGSVKQASFFDVDNTLIRGDSQEMEGRMLIPCLSHSPGKMLTGMGILAAMAVYRLGWISQTRQNEAYLNIYRGLHRQELDAVGQRLFDRQIRAGILTQSLELLESRRRNGDLIVLVSATTGHLLRPLERLIRPDRVFCTELEFDRDERATGLTLDGICIGSRKADIVRAFASVQGLNLASCHAYSDHHSDLPLLNCVGHPEVVNPTRKLARHALTAGWPVHRF